MLIEVTKERRCNLRHKCRNPGVTLFPTPSHPILQINFRNGLAKKTRIYTSPQGKIENANQDKIYFQALFCREDEGTDYESVRSLG